MPKLTAATRKALPTADFAVPGKRAFPVEDVGHAKAALSRVADKSPKVKAEVKAKVESKFPEMEVAGKKHKGKPFGAKAEGHPASHEAFHSLGNPGEGKY